MFRRVVIYVCLWEIIDHMTGEFINMVTQMLSMYMYTTVSTYMYIHGHGLFQSHTTLIL